MINWKTTLSLLIKRLLLLVVAFFVSRLFFIVINISSTGDYSSLDIFNVILYGFRFDYTSIIYYNSLFLVLSLLPFSFTNNKTFRGFLKSLFVVVNSALLLTNLGDSIYYQFSNKRTTFDIFNVGGVGNDFFSLLPSYIKDFWYVFVVWFVLVFILIKLYPKKKNKTRYFSKIRPPFVIVVRNILVYVFVIILLYVPARGIGLKPVRIITAASYVSADYIPFVLNTPFTLVTSFRNEELHVPEYFNEDINIILDLNKQYSDSSGINKKNVVILILESFGKEYIGFYNNNKGYTPFLDSIIANSLHCTNAFASGRKSIDALPAVLAGIPSLMEKPYITSHYASNKIYGLGKLLSDIGYHTSFFHGGKNGTMGFDHFSHLAGFDEYYGLNEYPDESHYDGKWGIFDEEFYKFYNNKLSSFNEPFVSCMFSLSSHHPYLIPDKHKNKFQEGPLAIHKSIEYADFALQTFFNKAQKEPWFENTIFVLTADHTSISKSKKYTSSVGSYSIPLIFYNPGDSAMVGEITHVVSQIDIMATVLDYLNYDIPFLTFGNSVLDADSGSFSMVNYSGVYQTLNNDTAVRFDGENYVSAYAYKTDTLLKNDLLKSGYQVSDQLDNLIKAFIQQHNYRIRNNKLTTSE